MYNDLYLYNLETEIFIESTELLFENINTNNSISLLLEDGNNDSSNILLKMADSIINKIKEIIDWIKDKIIGSKEEKDYKAVIDAYIKSNKDFTLTFDDDPEINYNNYVKIYNTIKSGNSNEDINKIINSEIKKGDKSYKKCQELLDKFNILLLKYNELAKSLKKDMKSSDSVLNKARADNLKKCLKISNLIRKNMSKLTYANIMKQPGITDKVKFWLKNDKNIPKIALVAAIAIGILNAERIKSDIVRDIKLTKAKNYIKKNYPNNKIYEIQKGRETDFYGSKKSKHSFGTINAGGIYGKDGTYVGGLTANVYGHLFRGYDPKENVYTKRG
jgi:hypothetical protein